MKAKHIIAGLTLAVSLGLGAVVGMAPKQEARVARAGEEPEVVESGEITIDMQDCWANGSSGWQCTVGMYFYAGSGENKQEAWSSLEYCEKGSKLANVSYELSFIPEKMIAVRLSDSATTGNWDQKWNQTGDLDYVPNANIMVMNNDGYAEVHFAYLEGKAAKTEDPDTHEWKWQKLDELNQVALNEKGNVVYINEDLTVTPWEEFLVYAYSNKYVGFSNVTFHKSIDSSKWDHPDQSNNIVYKGEEAMKIALVYDREAGEVLIADAYQYEIEVNEDFFTNWVNDIGTIKDAGATYDGGSYNALGKFFDYMGYEGAKHTLKSIKWKQHTEWIYFQWGAASDYLREGDEVVKLVFNFYRNEIDETPVASRDMFNDTFCGVTMLLRNYKIPSDVFDLFNGGDFYMNVELVDGRTHDYGGHTFGYLHINQTHQQVDDAQWLYYKGVQDASQNWEGEKASIFNIRKNYYLNASLREGFALNSFEEQFESQESFNTNFMKDDYGNDVGERHQDVAISFAKYRNRNDTNLPFNKTGNGFFKGWYGEGTADGINEEYRGYTATDDAIYRFLSRPFRLPANGIVSVKMAGHGASLHLIDFEGTHNELAFVDCQTFVDGNVDNIAWSGTNNVTLVRHIINFSKYAGRLVQLGIADVNQGAWSVANFDELRANYTELPALQVEAVKQEVEHPSYTAFRDVYVQAAEGNGGVDYKNDADNPGVDNSPLKEAADFVNSYLNTVRRHTENEGPCECNALFCAMHESNEVKALLNTYLGLSEEAQALICASDDYHREGATVANWTTTEIQKLNLGDSLAYLARVNKVNIPVSGAHTGGYNMNNLNGSNTAIIVVIIASLLGVTAFGAFFLLRKGRKER